MTQPSTVVADVSLADIEFFADNIDAERAAAAYKEHGCLVVRGLGKQYVGQMHRDILQTADTAIGQLEQAREVPEGWITPNGCLFIPAPENYTRDKQIMTIGINYQTSACFLQSALDAKTLDIVEAILGPNIETFGHGQSLVKEPVGGHPKHLHQDAAYFEHKYEGPVAILNYVIDTTLENGALYVVPGTHKAGNIKHIDTFSHLGLDEDEWPWEAGLPIEGKAGDAIFFHVQTVHGSKSNFSDTPRPVFINRYRRPDDYVTIGASTTANRAEAEKRAAEAKKTNEQRGLMVRGFRQS